MKTLRNMLLAIIAGSMIAIGSTLIIFNWLGKPREAVKDLPKFKTVLNKANASYNAIIRIKTLDNRFKCSGFVIDGEYAITAAHCITGYFGGMQSTPILISNSSDDKLELKAAAVGFDKSRDLGLIKGDFSNFKTLEINAYTVGFQTTNPIVACGYPSGQIELLCLPVVPTNGNYFFQVVAFGILFPGMSGGPVIDQALNVAIGLNSAVGPQGVLLSPLTGILSNFNIEPRQNK